MPSLSNPRTGSTTQIYGRGWGWVPGVWTLDTQIKRLRVGLEPGTPDQSVRFPNPCAMLAIGKFSFLFIPKGSITLSISSQPISKTC